MWARRSRQLHVYIRLLTQRGGEADLRCVVSSYSARACIPARSILCWWVLGPPLEWHPHLTLVPAPGLELPASHLSLLKDLISCVRYSLNGRKRSDTIHYIGYGPQRTFRRLRRMGGEMEAPSGTIHASITSKRRRVDSGS